MKYPETAKMAQAAFDGSGATTHQEFADIFECGLRTFRAWLAGEKDPPRIAKMVLGQAAKGWRPAK